MLAVAIARELSIKARTLLLDLDFFNRGLTGLFHSGRVIAKIAAPGFMPSTESPEWQLVQVAPNLVHVRYPDLTPQQIENLERLDACELAEALRTFLDSLRSAARCEAILVDCHGGPDRLSFAACMASDHTLLISEPDKITFYGTLHFVRQLEAVISPETAATLDLRLVLNKVLPAFSGFYLRRFYDQELRDIFHGRPLLAIFPVEMYLTKEFERTPLLTEMYPFSLLARKTRLLIRDLLGKNGGTSGYSSAKAARWRNYFLRNSIGKEPWFLDLNKVLATIALCGIAFGALSWYTAEIVRGRDRTPVLAATNLLVVWKIKNKPNWPDSDACQGMRLPDKVHCVKGDPELLYSIANERAQFYDGSPSDPLLGIRHQNLFDPSLRSDKEPFVEDNFAVLSNLPRYDWAAIRLYSFLTYPSYGVVPDAVLGGIGLFWFLEVLLLGWSVRIDRFFAYCWRAGHSVAALSAVILAAGVWFLPAVLFSGSIHDTNQGTDRDRWLWACGASLALLPVVWTELWRGYFNLRYEKRPGEALIRFLFLGYLAAAVLVNWGWG
jgi:cellulose biosynthesis protein BcsQ